MLIKEGLVYNLYKVLKIKNQDLLKSYYLSLLNFNSFLTEFENMKSKLSLEEINLIEDTFNSMDSNLIKTNMQKIYDNILCKHLKFQTYIDIDLKINKLENEKFYELIKENIDKLNNILRNKYKKTYSSLHSDILSKFFEIYNTYVIENPNLEKNAEITLVNYDYILTDNQKIKIFNKIQFNNEFISVIPLQYMLLNNNM